MGVNALSLSVTDLLGQLRLELRSSGATQAPTCSAYRPTPTSPIPGTRRRKYLEENLGTSDVALTEDDLRRVDEEVLVAAGDRYPTGAMTTINRRAMSKPASHG